MTKNNYNTTLLIDQLEQKTREWLQTKPITNPLMVGIHTSGLWLAQELHKRLQIEEDLGELSVTFYRDDYARVGLHPQNKPTRLPHSIENRHILLVDDVVYTGRTLRGAMNELFDYGRPASITALVLVARGARELPIEPQLVALHEEPGENSLYILDGPEPLILHLISKK